MSNLKEDLLNILYLARCLASADGEYDLTEKQFFKKLVTTFDLTPDEIKSFDRHKSIKEAIEQLDSLEVKKLLVDVLMVLASSDGEFAEKEQKFIKKVMQMINLKPSDYPVFKFGEEEVHKIYSNLDDFIGEIKEKAQKLYS